MHLLLAIDGSGASRRAKVHGNRCWHLLADLVASSDTILWLGCLLVVLVGANLGLEILSSANARSFLKGNIWMAIVTKFKAPPVWIETVAVTIDLLVSGRSMVSHRDVVLALDS